MERQDNTSCHFLLFLSAFLIFFSYILCQLPEKTEPALADKEIIMAALNIKSMNFGSNFLTGPAEEDQARGIINGLIHFHLLFDIYIWTHHLHFKPSTGHSTWCGQSWFNPKLNHSTVNIRPRLWSHLRSSNKLSALEFQNLIPFNPQRINQNLDALFDEF